MSLAIANLFLRAIVVQDSYLLTDIPSEAPLKSPGPNGLQVIFCTAVVPHR